MNRKREIEEKTHLQQSTDIDFPYYPSLARLFFLGTPSSRSLHSYDALVCGDNSEKALLGLEHESIL